MNINQRTQIAHVLKAIALMLLLTGNVGFALAGESGVSVVAKHESFLSSVWFMMLILLVIGFSFFLVFEKSSFYNRRLLINSRDLNRMRSDEIRIYFLYLGFLAPASELAIEFFQLRKHSELIPNLIVGVILMVIFLLSARWLRLKRYLHFFLIGFFILFSISTVVKLIFDGMELITFSEWMLVLFFSSYVFQNIRYYWMYASFHVCFSLSLFSNSLYEQQTAALFAVTTFIVLLLNHVRLLVFMHSRDKLIFTNAIVNQGKSLVISSDKDGRINFISENVREILGYEPEELLGNGWWDKTIDQNTAHANEREKIVNLYLNEQITTRMIRTAKGDYRWIQWYDKRFNENLIVGIGQDITELRKLETKQQERAERHDRQQSIINDLNKMQFKQKRTLNDQIKSILQMASEGFDVDRIGLWEYKDETMTCKNLYVKELMSFRKGEIIREQDYPKYFKVIQRGDVIHAPNVYENEDLAEFADNYLRDNGIMSTYDLPIFVGGKFKMVLCVETVRQQYTFDSDDQAFIKGIADLISIAIENQRRKDAEETLKESENNFRLINETINSVFWLYDLQKDKIIYISPSCENIFGVPENYFYASNDYWKNYVLDSDKKEILQAHQEILQRGSYHIEYRIRKNDQIYWIKEQSYAIYNDRGELIKSSGISTDITEEKKLREEYRQLSLVAQKTSNGVLITDRDARVIWANQGFLDLMEISLEELQGKRPRDLFIHPDLKESPEIKKLDEYNFTVELEIITLKGNKRWISINNTAVLDENGHLEQQIELITDITDRVLSSLQIEEQSKQLSSYAQELEFQNTLKEMLMQTRDIQDVTLNALAFIYVQFEHSRRIALLFPDEHEQVLSGYFLEQEELRKEEVLVKDVNSFEVSKRGEIFIRKDLLENREQNSVSDENNLEDGVRSYIIMPIRYQNKFLGQLMFGFSVPFELNENQIRLLSDSCQIIAISIHHIQLQQNLQLKTEDLLSSISYAQHIQQSILPDLRSFSPNISNVALLYEPKDLVSGDFYWAKETERYSFMAIADCTGHGVPGAFLTLLGMNILEQLIGIEQIHDPSLVLRKLDRRLFGMLNSGSTDHLIQDGMEIALCVYDKQEKVLTYSGAGLGILYFQHGEEIHVRGQRVSIADMRDGEFDFENTTVPISGNEYFFMATDGFQDQLGGERFKRYSKNKLIQLLNEHKEKPAPEQEKIWHNTIRDYMQNYPQIDDFTVIGFTIKP